MPEKPPRRVKSHFKSLEEWDERVNTHARPARDDDTPVLMGQTGPYPHRRATHEEIMALVEEQRARYGEVPDATPARRDSPPTSESTSEAPSNT